MIEQAATDELTSRLGTPTTVVPRVLLLQRVPEAHSTKQIEDSVGWGLETTAEVLSNGVVTVPEHAQVVYDAVTCPVW
jgi:hypothetical protein